MSVNSTAPNCFTLRESKKIFLAFSVTNIVLMLPLSALVLHLGHRRWLQRRDHHASPTGDSNIFTYQMAAMEMVGVLGCFLFSVGMNTNLLEMTMYGYYIFFCTWCVKIHFHAMTCVERYLAVVRPLAYLGLKNPACRKVRRFLLVALWLLSWVWMIVMIQTNSSPDANIYFIFVVLGLCLVCFCCGSVLHALRRPRPGAAGCDGKQLDQSKQRAFNTVVAIMAALWVCLGGILVCAVLLQAPALSDAGRCVVQACSVWFTLPSSLVQPLLYLHRARN